MGRSVLLTRPESPEIKRAQMSLVSERLGRGLRLEGPFSDKGDAVAEIADQVKKEFRTGDSREIVDLAARAIRPQDLLSGNQRPSMLRIPFTLSMDPTSDCPESAGEVASGPISKFDTKDAREGDITALTLLAVSVLRKLGVESYFTLYNFRDNVIDQALNDIGAIFAGRAVPAIIVADRAETRIGTVLPKPFSSFLKSPPESFEVLDNEALLSLIRIQNGYCRAEGLMGLVANGQPANEAIRIARYTSQAMEAGHLLHEGMALWTMDEAIESGNVSTKALGLGELESTRISVEDSLVHTIMCRQCHIAAAGSLIMPESIARELSDMAQGPDHGRGISVYLKGIADSDELRSLREYLGYAHLMNQHMHSGTECRTARTDN